MQRLISFTTVLKVLLLARVASPAEPPGQEITIDGKPIQGRARIEITTDKRDPGAASPTGREPRILWSRRWQARWQRALADGHPWVRWLRQAVDNPKSAYFDKELYPAVLYQITGDVQYARQAWGTMAQKTAKAPSSDGLRANFVTWLILYEWLYPALTDDERQQWAAHLDRCALQAANVSLGDSDRVVGYYFGVAVWASLGSEVARGVLDSDHYRLARERLRGWAELARGGEWIEGTYYNRGTVPTLLQGLDALRDLGAADEFGDLWALVPDFAAAAVHRMSGDLAAQWNWGATQDLWLHKVTRYDFLLPGWAAMAVGSDPIHRVLQSQIARASARGGYAAKPRAEFFLHADPAWSSSPPIPPSPLPPFLLVPGQQMLYARSSWDSDATLVGFRCGRHNQVHHPTFDAGNFEVYRRGEWAITSPWRYDDVGTVDGRGGNNSLLVGNQPLNFERREMLGAGVVIGHSSLVIGDDQPMTNDKGQMTPVYYLVLETGGPWRNGQGAIEYLHNHKRWLVWLPPDGGQRSEVRGQDAQADVILVRDVLNVSQPTDQRFNPSGRKSKAYNLGAAWQRHAEYIESQTEDDEGKGGGGEGGNEVLGQDPRPIPLVQWVIHAPASAKPSYDDAAGPPGWIEWQTPGGQQVRVTTPVCRSGDAKHTPHVELVDEKELFADVATWKVAEKERGWQARISPAGFTGGELELLHAVVVSDGDPDAQGQASVTLDPDGAVLVRRAGHQDARVMFSDKGVEVR